jgi:hypothetical protein
VTVVRWERDGASVVCAVGDSPMSFTDTCTLLLMHLLIYAKGKKVNQGDIYGVGVKLQILSLKVIVPSLSSPRLSNDSRNI